METGQLHDMAGPSSCYRDSNVMETGQLHDMAGPSSCYRDSNVMDTGQPTRYDWSIILLQGQ